MHHTLAKIASTMDTVRCGRDNRLSFKFAEFKSYYVEPKNILYVANLFRDFFSVANHVGY